MMAIYGSTLSTIQIWNSAVIPLRHQKELPSTTNEIRDKAFLSTRLVHQTGFYPVTKKFRTVRLDHEEKFLMRQTGMRLSQLNGQDVYEVESSQPDFGTVKKGL